MVSVFGVAASSLAPHHFWITLQLRATSYLSQPLRRAGLATPGVLTHLSFPALANLETTHTHLAMQTFVLKPDGSDMMVFECGKCSSFISCVSRDHASRPGIRVHLISSQLS